MDKKNTVKESLTASIRIGDCLIKEGFATADDIARAIELQKKEEKLIKFSDRPIFPPLDRLSRDQIKFILGHPPLDSNIGLICVQKGLIGKPELYDLLKDNTESSSLGEALIKKGVLTGDKLEEILFENLGAAVFGDIALKLMLITPDELNRALNAKRSPKTLGRILCDMGVINPADLDYVLKKYGKQIKFGEILVKEGILDQSRLMTALQEQFHREMPLGKILMEKNLITMDQLYHALSIQHNIPFRKITKLDLFGAQKTALTNIIGQKYALKNRILPISLEGRKMTVATYDPEHLSAATDIKNVYTYLEMSCLFITEDNFIRLFDELYQASPAKTAASAKTAVPKGTALNVESLHISLDTQTDDFKPGAKTDYGLEKIEAMELVNYIIKYGIANNASDIHIEQDRKNPQLRYRIDGMLQTLQQGWLDNKLRELVNSVISRVKVMSNLDIAERRLPQDGVFRVNYFDPIRKEPVDLDFRVATCPGIVGENVTIRILDPRKAKVDIDSLDHSLHVADPFKKLLKSAAGMILVSGPTGSGKTSTLYSALRYVYNPSVKIITAEDPIEYSFPGIMQTQINAKINLNFARLLRSFLRLDPDIILIGEIRDQETAHISFDAAQTGHLMLSTVHTNDAAGAITRLIDLGIDYNQLASSLMCVVAQRLLRRICPVCRVRYRPSEYEWEPLFFTYPEHIEFFRGEGCPDCNYSGFNGRTLISEILIVDQDIARALNRESPVSEIKALAQTNGMMTMVDDGLAKMSSTTLSELIRVVPNEMLKNFKARQKAAA
ncbi:MAG: ATPase, T2SS/T4P/T4SS family [Thermodesulfobacteriota bacterium]